MLSFRRLSWILLLVLLLVPATGCGDCADTPAEGYTSPLLVTVDDSLPADLQARQETVKSVLDLLVVVVPWRNVPTFARGVRFEESREDFFEGGAIRLDRWEFDGSPRGDDVPVVLYLDLDNTGRNQLEVRRVYTVTPSDDGNIVHRKAKRERG